MCRRVWWVAETQCRLCCLVGAGENVKGRCSDDVTGRFVQGTHPGGGLRLCLNNMLICAKPASLAGSRMSQCPQDACLEARAYGGCGRGRFPRLMHCDRWQRGSMCHGTQGGSDNMQLLGGGQSAGVVGVRRFRADCNLRSVSYLTWCAC